MTTETSRLYARGLMLSAAGMLLISPDGLLLRLIEQAGTWDIAFYRSLFIGLSLTTVLLITRRGRLGPAIRGLGRLGWASALCLTAANLGFIAAITNTSVANTLVLLATMPLFSAVLGWLMLREAVALRTRVAIALALVGVVVIFSGSIGGGTLAGDLTALATAMLHGLNLVILRKHRGTEPIMMPALAVAGFLAAILTLPLSAPAAVTAHDLGIIAFAGLFQIPLALVLFFSGTRYVAAAEVALMSLIETALGPFWAWLGVGEVPPAQTVIGAAIVVLAIVVNSLLGLHRWRRTRGMVAPAPEPAPEAEFSPSSARRRNRRE